MHSTAGFHVLPEKFLMRVGLFSGLKLNHCGRESAEFFVCSFEIVFETRSNPMNISDTSSVRISRSAFVSRELLRLLLRRELIGLHINGFVDRLLADTLAEWFVKHRSRQNYRYFHRTKHLQASTTDRVGTPVSELYSSFMGGDNAWADDRAAMESYERTGDEQLRQVREVCFPQSAPVDCLRLLIDELSPSGAHIARFGGLRPHVGIARILTGSPDAPDIEDPHVDALPAQVRRYEDQFSAIIYLRVPTLGGELELWDVARTTAENLTRDDGTLDRRQLTEPSVICPARGDLVIINTRYPHGVRGFRTGTRVVQTCFIGIAADNRLEFWS
jgi:2OG-Fe(II) oxygenase superfamily